MLYEFVYIPQAGFHIEVFINTKNRWVECRYDGKVQATGRINLLGKIDWVSLIGFCSMQRTGLESYIQGASDVLFQYAIKR